MVVRLTYKMVILAALALGGCRASSPSPTPAGVTPPTSLLGDFVDDYGNRYSITPAVWTQLPHGRLKVLRWNAAGQYLIARNDSSNRYGPGRWTRIDWVLLPDMAPYEWAYCLSAYEAATAAAAESTTVARRDTPRTGCNGYPFSRMRRPG